MNRAFYISEAEVENSFGGLKYIHPYIIDVYDSTRDRLGIPLNITSITRSKEKQLRLFDQGLTKVKFSPHIAYIYTPEKIEIYDPEKEYDSSWDGAKIYSFAMDIRVPRTMADGQEFKDFIRDRMGYKDLRIGYYLYQRQGRCFIHIDCAYLLPDFLKSQLSEKTLHAWKPGVMW